MPRKAGLPKRLSLNGKSRSTGKANKNARKWDEVTHERSFTSVMNGVVHFVPKQMRKFAIINGQDDTESEHKALLANIADIQRKIDRLTAIMHRSGATAEEKSNAEKKRLKLSSLHTRQIQLLQTANTIEATKLNQMKARTIIRNAVENQQLVRLEKGKLVPKKTEVWSEAEKAKIMQEMFDEFGED